MYVPALGQPLFRFLNAALIAVPLLGAAVSAQPVLLPALSDHSSGELTIYSSLDNDLALPMLKAFQSAHPDITIHYEELLTSALYDRVVHETDAGGPTADFVFSSAMDLQVKLANDGYAMPVITPDTPDWPDWANWRDTAYALTFEPAVFAYNKQSFADTTPPETRLDLMEWIESDPDLVHGRIGTYDITRSGVGYLFMARDQELYQGIWDVVAAMGRADLRQYPTSRELLERITDGRLSFGYNLLGSYATDWARQYPDQVGVILPRDFTVVISRVALVPASAGSPENGAAFLAYMMSEEGQLLLSQTLRLSAVSLEVAGQTTPAGSLQDLSGLRLKPLPVSPGLLAYLDQATRARLLERWDRAIAGR
ncbi:ABC transporter substrate-binding protein [Paracoccus caeni]|uniref:ABC transporter substrate-binding protein n=1 Tax=Paracoccus caeni TaxID=657651 RepID=A0A934W102_9RHOB|nr:ABC transporter substrate-binding protein [Paracoccus caeni]MBK4216888.1 ABC transporter substrate-binding protein [Paracoccus caeni]